MDNAIGSKIRGTIIKVPDSNPGLLFVNNEQKEFRLERIWKSPVAPAANMVVDVELDSSGSILAITVVDPKQLNKQQFDAVSGRLEEQGKQIFEMVRQRVVTLAALMGNLTLGATVAVWIAWFLLNAAVIRFGFLGSKSFTFWGLLGLDLENPMNLGVGSHGLFALIGLASIAAPFAAPFLRHRHANYLNAAPLAYTVIAVLKIRSEVSRTAGANAMGFSFGMYVLFIAGLILAVQAYQGRHSWSIPSGQAHSRS